MREKHSLSAIQAEISSAFGYVPAYLTVVDSPAVLATLWADMRSGYVDNQLPKIFRDKVMAYLSRYCGIPYCLVVHSCMLIPLGMTPAEVFAFVELPLPNDADMRGVIRRLDAIAGVLDEMPPAGSELDGALVRCIIGIYSGNSLSEEGRKACRRVLGPERYDQLILFLAWVSSLFVWIDAHPEIDYRKDVALRPVLEQCIHDEPRLGELFAAQEARTNRERLFRGADASAIGLLDAVLAASPVGFALFDRDLRFVRVNPTLAAMHGQTIEEHAGRSLRQILPAGADLLEPLVRQVFATHVPILSFEAVVTTPSGARDWLVNLFPVREPDGSVATVGMQVTDVASLATDRRRAEELAAERLAQQKWFESILDLTPTPLLLLDPATARVTFANRAAERLAGSSAVDVEGWRRWEPLLARAAGAEKLVAFEAESEAATGRRTVLVNSEHSTATLGHPEISVVTLEDVTRLKDIQRQLEAAIRVREDFLAVASHELRTPLTTLSLSSDRLLMLCEAKAAPDLTRVMEKAGDIKRQAQRLDRLIGTLLDVSRLRAGDIPLKLEHVDLVAIARSVVARFRDELEHAGCAVTLTTASSVVGQWDRTCLDQIVTNLLSNAIKFGRGRPIEIAVAGTASSARLTIRDRGVGIDPERQSKIFDRFERAVTERHYGGLGLGLWIVRRAVEALSGTVSVESKPGEGATFIVVLPRGR